MRNLSFKESVRLQQENQDYLSVLHAEMGSIAAFRVFGMPIYAIAEPTVIRELLIKHAGSLKRDLITSRAFRRVMGNGVFIAEGNLWKKQRKMMQPAFHARRIRNYTDTMAQYTRELIASLPPGQPFDLDKAMTELTLRIIAKTMYGVDLQEEVAEIGRNMKTALTVIEVHIGSAMPAPAWVPTPNNRRQQNALDNIHTILRRVIAERRAADTDAGDLLSMLLAARDEDGNPMPEKQLLDECVTLFVAGHETTAAALTWAWYLLMQNPEITERLRAEVNSVLGDQPVSIERLAEMPFLEAVIKETLRLYPVATGFARTPTEPITIDDYTFSTRSMIVINIFELHRRAELFPDPLTFNPDRFLDPDNQPDRYSYMPFGAGSRICLGNMFAMLEAQIILAEMIRALDLTRTETHPLKAVRLVTLRPTTTLTVTASPLREAAC